MLAVFSHRLKGPVYRNWGRTVEIWSHGYSMFFANTFHSPCDTPPYPTAIYVIKQGFYPACIYASGEKNL